MIPVALRLPLAPPQAVGEVDVTLWENGGEIAVILAHGAGTDQRGVVLRMVAEGIARAGHTVLTFNFAYTQAGRRIPDPHSRLLAAWRDVITGARDRLGASRRLVIGGRSMGGRMASMLAAEEDLCQGLLLLGYPLHAAGLPERLRTAHWPALRVPTLFVQGDRDALCPLDVLARERAALLARAPTRVHVVAKADHSFGVRAHDGRTQGEVLDEVIHASTEWLDLMTSAGFQPGEEACDVGAQGSVLVDGGDEL
ncbi:MAG: alpha/beta hydrolase family protein [Egibacteraceae bacterium]